MILDDKLLDEVTARAKTSERLRMNFDLLVKTGAETPQKQENATL